MPNLKILALVLVSAAGLLSFGHKQAVQNFQLTSEKDEGLSKGGLDNEAFSFYKSVHVTFDFDPKVIEEGFEGNFFMDWNGAVATASLTMPGHRPEVYVMAHFSEDFKLKCMEFPEGLDETESDYVLLLKNLVLDYAYKTNRDENGEYEASTRSQELSQGLKQVTKVKYGYLDVDKAGLKIEKSLHEIRHARALVEAKGEEQYHFLLNNKKSAFTKTKYRLLAKVGASRPEIRKDRKLGKCTENFSLEIKEVWKISSDDFRSLLNGLSHKETQSRHVSMRKTLKALRNTPEFLTDYIRWFQSIKTDRQISSLAVGILSSLGSPEAQRELINLFNSADAATGHLQFQVINAFTLSASPMTRETRKFLRNQMKGHHAAFAEGAAYALGSSIQNDSSASHSDLQFLITALEEAVDDRARMVYLDALGNSRSEEAYPVLQKYATSENKFIREKALMAMNSL